MACLLFVLLSLEMIVDAQTCGGHCAAPRCSGKASAECNAAGTGCTWVLAQPASCTKPPVSYCEETYSSSTDCNAAAGCAWSNTGTTCIISENPVQCYWNTSSRCVAGCQESSTGSPCYSTSVRENELCNQRPAANCTKYFDNRLTYCKLSGQNCVAMNDAEQYTAYCNAQSAGACTGDCKVSGTTCIPKTYKESMDEQCIEFNQEDCQIDEPAIYCVWTSGKCEARTEEQMLVQMCSFLDQEGTLSDCVSESWGACHVVSDHCVRNPNAEQPADFCVPYSSMPYCDWDASQGNCDYGGNNICVPYPCVSGVSCSPNSVSAGCVTKSGGYCAQSLTCSSTGTCADGCISTPFEPGKCAPKPVLEEQCVGNGTCGTVASSAGCTNVPGTDPCPNAPSDSGMVFATPIFLYILFTLLVLF